MKRGYCYLIAEQRTSRYKIGKSKAPTHRLRQLQTGNPNRLALVCAIATPNMDATENELHTRYSHKKTHIDGKGEWFLLSWDDIANIRGQNGAW